MTRIFTGFWGEALLRDRLFDLYLIQGYLTDISIILNYDKWHGIAFRLNGTEYFQFFAILKCNDWTDKI
jgi:hypothetical protein